jgi:hypothetical protein
MNRFREYSKKRSIVKECPCGKSNRDGKFVPFDGAEKCGYCFSCAKNILPERNEEPEVSFLPKQIKAKPKIEFIQQDYFKKSIEWNGRNNFISFLKSHFGQEKAVDLICLYKIGGAKKWAGANVFWYLDQNENITSGKIMLYNEQTGKRVKEPFNRISWVHAELKIPNENIRKCLFGEHLLTLHKEKPIALVESEKTAVIASIYFSDYIWLATGGIANLSYERMKVLRNRKVVLFPDLGAFDLWSQKAEEFKKWLDIRVSDYLEKIATSEEREQKLDLADYLISQLE